MKRVWFNKTFSSVGSAFRLIREADKGREYEIMCTSTNARAPAFMYADKTAVEPIGLLGESYVSWCLDFCKKSKVDIFIPGKEASIISANKERFEAVGVRVMSVGSQETLHLLHDKAKFYEEVDCKLAPPAQFRAVETVEEFDAAYQELKEDHGKLCIKPSVSVYGLGFSFIDENRSSAQILMEGVAYHVCKNDLRSGLAAMGKFRPMLVMEFLGGDEFSVDCVGDNGKLIAAVCRRKSSKAGHGQTIDMREDIMKSVRELAKTYSLSGNFNVQFREGENGLGLLEINPRMSGGIAMACLAGPNLPYIALAGFDKGFDTLEIPEVNNGIHVGEVAIATIFK